MTEETFSTQNYLKTIHKLTSAGKSASTSELATRLGIAPASVTGMVQKMASADPPLVYYKKHQGVRLTTAGEKAALAVIRRHRLLETYLVTALGYSWDEVHDEAEHLEHFISPMLEARIANALGHPTHDPHGDPIPSANLELPESAERPLSALMPRQAGTICRVAADPALLRHADGLGLIPGARVSVESYSEIDQNMTIRTEKSAHVLGIKITSRIFIEVT
jgi:DtxR family transcriptional regulator, Mn-dependent transcriptional regulator